MRGEVLGIERGRRWSDEEKLAVVSLVAIEGAAVTRAAQPHEMSRQQVYAWRHALKKKGLWSPDGGAILLPIGFPVIAETPREREPVPSVPVERRLENGRCLRFDSAMDAAVSTRLIRAAEKA